MNKMHYRHVQYISKQLSITVPCGTDAHITKDTTKNTNLVTCKRCVAWLKKRNLK
jgi:hypothetical protein